MMKEKGNEMERVATDFSHWEGEESFLLEIVLMMMQFGIEGEMGEIDLDTAQVAEIGRVVVVVGDF